MNAAHFREKIVFTLLVVVYLVPVWAFHYFPTQDGPNHVDNAAQLTHYLKSNTLPKYFTLNLRLVPNWLSNAVLAGLMFFVSAITAEKILISLFVVLLPLSIRYSLSAINPDSRVFSLLAFPFIYNEILFRGFYNFIFSIPVFFFIVGYWLRHRNGSRIRDVVPLAILILLIYFCHIVGLASLSITLCILTVSAVPFSLRDFRRDGLEYVWRLLRSPVWRSLLALAPALILAGVFFVQHAGHPPTWNRRPFQFFIWPFYGVVAIANSAVSLLISTAVVGILFLGLFYVLRRRLAQETRTRWNGFLWAAGVLLILYYIAPYSSSGGTIINPRFVLFSLPLVILWLGAQDFSERAKARITGTALVLALLLIVFNLPVIAKVNEDMDEYLSGMNQIEPGNTLFAVCLANEGCGIARNRGYLRISPFQHLSGYISAQRNLVNLSIIDPHTDYFPIRYRDRLDPFPYFNENWIGEERVWGGNIASYAGRTGGQVDYVLLWGIADALDNHENIAGMLEWLNKEYELFFTSPQHGRLQLYRRKTF